MALVAQSILARSLLPLLQAACGCAGAQITGDAPGPKTPGDASCHGLLPSTAVHPEGLCASGSSPKRSLWSCPAWHPHPLHGCPRWEGVNGARFAPLPSWDPFGSEPGTSLHPSRVNPAWAVQTPPAEVSTQPVCSGK